jgi:radical SAM superfamily enzyme YgiQ (UPF0313 family)
MPANSSGSGRCMVHPAGQPPAVVHPQGTRARVLLSSVFGPFARDDEYGSRAINPMELYHNQVTRVQGAFSLRMFHRSWGLMFLQANLRSSCTLLDFPSLDRFVAELKTRRYDVVGIGGITVNWLKVKKMCELVREHQPQATIVVGGHVANIPDLDERIDADHIVRGEGVRWFRQYLGEDPDAPVRHPLMSSRIGTRNAGITPKEAPGEVAMVLVPSVGCPVGCNFCATSAMFGGKGKHVNFYRTGEELFDVMCGIERQTKTRSFFVLDENFLLDRPRALRLRDLMEEHGKPWSLYVFSSARVVRSYTMEQLISLGVSWIWMGLEGENSQYGKLSGVDTFALVRELQSHGIRVLGSTIIGLENHTHENIDEVIDYAVRHDCDFHQFMLYTPVPGTPLDRQLRARGLIKPEDECPHADAHGQCKFNYRHPHINDGRESEYIVRAFQRDLERNGPSILRTVRTMMRGWQRYHDHPNPRIRDRFAWEVLDYDTTFAAMAAAARRWYRDNRRVRARVSELLDELCRVFGLKARLAALVGGPYLYWKIRREEKRLRRGWTYEPPTFFETNHPELLAPAGGNGSPAAAGGGPTMPGRCRFVTPQVVSVPAALPMETRLDLAEPVAVE